MGQGPRLGHPCGLRSMAVSPAERLDRHIVYSRVIWRKRSMPPNVWPNFVVEGLLAVVLLAALRLRYPHHE